MDTRLPFAAYLEHLRADSARFVSALDGVDPGAPVPTCPQWSAADLVAHLTEVQSFWAAVVRGRLGTDADVEAVAAPDRPESFEDQLLELRAATARLVTVLADTPPETPAWPGRPSRPSASPIAVRPSKRWSTGSTPSSPPVGAPGWIRRSPPTGSMKRCA